ncbi:MAG: hypothetical protein JXQ72_12915 [Anaerolineae bacterium]|nr:hypothetical protein [Anaerolineae bacterium]
MTLHRLIVGTILAALVIVASIDTWRAATDSPWSSLNSDQYAIGAMYFKKADDSLFQRDPVYAFEDSYASYTPSFLFLIEQIGDTLTEGNFIKASALLQGPVLATFVIAAYLLFWQVSQSAVASVVLTLVAANGMKSLKTFWDAIGLSAMLPRAVALPFIVLAAYTFIRATNSTQRVRWWWAATGLLTGLVANLHPPSGMILALTLGCTGLFQFRQRRKHERRAHFINLLLLAGGVILAGIPVVFSIGGDVAAADIPVTDFSAYVDRLQVRLSMFPFRTHMGRITSLTPDQQIMIGLVWFPLTLYAWVMMKPRRYPWTVLPFIFVQIAYMWLLTVPLGVILAIGVFYAWRWRVRDLERELIWMELTAAIIFTAYFLPVALRAIWLHFELAALTSPIIQLPRGTKLFALVAAVVGARLLALLLARWRDLPRAQVWIELLGVLAIVLFKEPETFHIPLVLLYLLRDRPAVWRRDQPLVFAAWVALSTQIAFALLVDNVSSVSVLIGAAQGLWAWITLRIRVPRAVLVGGGILLAGIVLALASTLSFGGDTDSALDALADGLRPGANPYILYAGVAALILFLVWDKHEAPERWQETRLLGYLGAALLVLFGLQLLETTGITNALDDKVPPSAPYTLGTWAKTHTDTDALFLYRDLVKSSDSAEFRLWSQRATWTAFKDLDFHALIRPGTFVDEYERWLRLMSLDDAGLVDEAARSGLDYIVHPLDDDPLPLPLVYRDDATNTGVYRYTVPPDTLRDAVTLNTDMTLLKWAFSRTTTRACHTITVDTWWEITGDMEKTYTLSLQTIDGQNVIVQRQHPFAPALYSDDGDAPAFELLGITIPCDTPSGDYTVTLTLYTGDASAGDPVPLQTLTVKDSTS